MKKALVLLMLLVCIVICAVACGDVESTTTATTTTEVTPLDSFASIKLADEDLSGYTIVYAQSDLADEAAANPTYYPVWDFNRLTAERLADLIFDVSGIRLPIALDVENAVGEKEILIGETNRELTDTLSLSKIKTVEYTVTVSGKTLVICGGRYGSTWHAIDYIEDTFTKALAAGNADFTFASDLSYKGKFQYVSIACIGDSITQGVGVDKSSHTYSEQLERWLWKDAVVYNLGNSGKTMRDDLADSYMKTTTWKKALSLAPSIDVFTVMLGTNDSNRDRSWTTADTTKFKTDCETMFSALKAKNNDVQFVIMNCPAYFGSAAFGSAKVRGIQSELVDEMNEKGYKTSFFDMYAVTASLRSHYPDLLHPNADGHTVMAEKLAEEMAVIVADILK